VALTIPTGIFPAYQHFIYKKDLKKYYMQKNTNKNILTLNT